MDTFKAFIRKVGKWTCTAFSWAFMAVTIALAIPALVAYVVYSLFNLGVESCEQ